MILVRDIENGIHRDDPDEQNDLGVREIEIGMHRDDPDEKNIWILERLRLGFLEMIQKKNG